LLKILNGLEIKKGADCGRILREAKSTRRLLHT